MRLVVLNLVSPPATMSGYVRRFLHELSPGVYVGCAGTDLVSDLVAALDAVRAVGFLVTSSQRRETGYEVLYFSRPDRAMVDFDGVLLLEKTMKISS